MVAQGGELIQIVHPWTSKNGLDLAHEQLCEVVRQLIAK